MLGSRRYSTEQTGSDRIREGTVGLTDSPTATNDSIPSLVQELGSRTSVLDVYSNTKRDL